MDRKKPEALNWWLVAVAIGGSLVAGLADVLLHFA